MFDKCIPQNKCKHEIGDRVLYHHQQEGYFRKTLVLLAKLTKKMNLPRLDHHQDH